MKKIVTVILVCFCFSPAFAQGEKTAAEIATGKVGAEITRQMQAATSQAARAESQIAAEFTRQMRHAQRQTNLLSQVEKYKLVPLIIPEIVLSVPTKVALPASTQDKEKAVGSLLLSTYLLYQNEDAQLESYLTHLSKVGTSKFLYRGLHLSDLKEVSYILQHGLTLDKTGYNSIYMTANPAVARHYAKVEKGIPVVVMMDRSALAGSLRRGNLSEPYAEKDVPAEAVLRVFVLLDINGTPGWYKTTLENERLVFMPVAAALGHTSATAIDLRVLPDEQLRKAISNDDEMRLFVPETFIQADNTLYRGLRLKNTAELQNI